MSRLRLTLYPAFAALSLGGLIAACATPEADLGTADNPIVMSFVPSGEQEEIATGSEELGALLEEETGVVIETNVATSYAAVIEAMGAGNTHFAWLPTFSYILAHERYGVMPLLVVGRYGSTSYAGQIVARADSGIGSLEDLAGKTFCRSDPVSTSSWIVPMVMMAAAGVEESELAQVVEAGSHDGVIAAVYNGDCDAGATWVDARGEVEEEYPDVFEEVAVIATSADIPNDNLSYLPSLPDEVVTKVHDALLVVLATDAGHDALGELYGVESLEEVDDSFYDGFRVILERSGIPVEELSGE